jgi:hypothetical protein
MAAITTTHVDDSLTPDQALRRAWMIWLTLLFIPFFAFMGLIFYLMTGPGPVRSGLAHGFFFASMAWIALATPVGFYLRARLFRAYDRGQPVQPRAYVIGMTLIWLPLEIGGLMAIIGAFVSNSLIPNIIPAMLAFVLFTPFWPSGHAMTRALGDKDDFELYKEPR